MKDRLSILARALAWLALAASAGAEVREEAEPFPPAAGKNPDADATLWMIKERDVLGFGTECVGTDAGQAHMFEPQYPCHHYMHGAGRYGLQCMTNLDLLPATGALIIAPPLKIEDGSGSPLRVLALVPA